MGKYRKTDGTVTVKGEDGRIRDNVAAGTLTGPGASPTVNGWTYEFATWTGAPWECPGCDEPSEPFEDSNACESCTLNTRARDSRFHPQALEWALSFASDDTERAAVTAVLAELTIEQQTEHYVSSAGQRALGKQFKKAAAEASAVRRENARSLLRNTQQQKKRRGHDFYPTKTEWARIPQDPQNLPLDEHVVHAHYFCGGNDWWITSVDNDGIAFGYVRLAVSPDTPEWGVIDLVELENAQADWMVVERELGWEPTRFADIPKL